jgi:hypothetical protein
MAKNLAFISSSIEYTKGILPLVRQMESVGDYQVYWICFRNFERKWLLQNGVSEDRILDTLKTFNKKKYSYVECTELLNVLENNKHPLINDIILMDRLLKQKSKFFGYAYLSHIQEIVTDFLIRKKIQLVSGGRDTALQISCSKICDRLGILYTIATLVRLPDDRFVYFYGIKEFDFINFKQPTEIDIEKARLFLKHFREDKPIPSAVYFEKRNNQFVKRIPRDIKMALNLFLQGFLYDRRNDFTRYRFLQLIEMYFKRRFNAFLIKIVNIFEPLGVKPFVIYAYHMQPESVIDVLASFYSDQFALIKQIARSLPVTHELYVKPHPDHLGGLSREALLKIKAIPGVRLISPYHSSHDLMIRASAIITPAGTMAYQAVLHGVPSVIFAPEFFGKIPGVFICNSINELNDLLKKILNDRSMINDDAIIKFLANIFANSFVGRQTTYLGPFEKDEIHTLMLSYNLIFEVLELDKKVKNQN